MGQLTLRVLRSPPGSHPQPRHLAGGPWRALSALPPYTLSPGRTGGDAGQCQQGASALISSPYSLVLGGGEHPWPYLGLD